MKTLYLSMLFAACVGCGDNGPDINVVENTVDFGATDCGATATPRALLVTNPTDSNFNYTIALDPKSHYTVVPMAGSVLARSQARVMIYSQAIPAESAVTANLYGETVTVTTDLPGDPPHAVAITQTAHGAILHLSSDTVGFGTPQPVGGTAATMPLMVTNAGNAAVSMTAASSGMAFDFLPAGAQPIAAGATIAGTVEYFGTANVNERNELKFVVDGPTCAAVPTTIASGTGTLKGLAAHAVPAHDRGRPNRNGGAGTLCVLTTTGVVACTGRNTFGMRGATDAYLSTLGVTFGGGGSGSTAFGQFGTFNAVQTEHGILRDVVELAGGRGFYCARRQEKDVWCWGAYPGAGRPNRTAELVSNPFASQVIASGITRLAVGYSNICTVREPFGNVICKGHDSGSSASYDRTSWQLPGAIELAISGGAGYGVLTDGSVMSFGRNNAGERGNTDGSNSPASAVTGLTNITKVVAGGDSGPNRGGRFGCALDTNKDVWCWGRNHHGQLGRGTTTNRGGGGSSVAQQVMIDVETTMSNVTDLAVGQHHACAIIETITKGGTVHGVSCWGRGREGQIGSGNTADSVVNPEPTVPPITNAVNLGLGVRASCVVLATGAIRCWGELGSSVSGPTAIDAFEP